MPLFLRQTKRAAGSRRLGSTTVFTFLGCLELTLSTVAVLKGCLCGAIRGLPEDKRVLMYVLVLGSPGLIIVDHIHFQYNGMLLGQLPLPSLTFSPISECFLPCLSFPTQL